MDCPIGGAFFMFKGLMKNLGRAAVLLAICLSAFVPIMNITAESINEIYAAEGQREAGGQSSVPGFLEFDSPEPYVYTLSMMGRSISMDFRSIAERADFIGKSILLMQNRKQ
jgi:hypothetical protein